VATFFTGSRFSVDFNNITNDGNTAISQWESPAHGLEAVLDLKNLALGLAILFLARVLGLLYFINNIKNENIQEKSKRQLWYNAIPFVVFFLAFVISIFLSDGYSYLASSKQVYLEQFKYLKNLIEMPVVGFMFLTGVCLVLFGIAASLFSKTKQGIWYSGCGTIITVFSLFLDVGFNNTAFYPSNFDFQSSITIENGSSSAYTLTVMSYVSMLVPFVAAYIIWAWRTINKKQIDEEELKEEGHIY
jgi:cytochrome d ubiquinol oxidase subunit II